MSLRSVRNQSHEASAFDGSREVFLVLNRCSAVVFWNNFSVFSEEFLQKASVLVINVIDLISSEVAFAIFVSWHGLNFLETRTCCRRGRNQRRHFLALAFHHSLRHQVVCRA